MTKIYGTNVGLLSDIHLGNYKDDPRWHQYAMELAHWIKTKYTEAGITDIIIAGDVFHNRFEISVRTLAIACEFFEVLKDFNIIITVGNHDAYYRDRSDLHSLGIFDKWDNITIIPELDVVNHCGKRIALCPWAIELDHIPVCDIIIGHFEIVGFSVAHQKACMVGLKSGELLARAPLILSGHFHMAAERYYERGTIRYLGSPLQLNWGEAGDNKSIYILNIETSQVSRIINDVSPKHVRIRYSDWINAPSSELARVPGNIINAVVDISAEPSDARVTEFTAAIVAAKPSHHKVTFTAFNHGAKYMSEIEFDGVDVEKSIRQFVEKLDLQEPVKGNVLRHTVDLYNKYA